MRKYWHVINIGIQNNLAYRVNFLARALFGLIPLTAMLYLWRAIYAGKGESAGDVAGFSLAQMISYYLIVQIVDALTAVNEDDWQIATDIKDGNISQFLLKPVNYLWYRLCLFFAGRVTYMAVAAVPLALFIGWHHANFVLPQSFADLGLFMLSLVLTALLQFFMSYAMASLAFLVIIHKLEYFINARIVGSQIEASAWELLLAIVVMEAAFGLPGVVAAPVFYAYLKAELTARGWV